MLRDVEKIDRATLQVWLEQPEAELATAGAGAPREGFMSLDEVDLPEDANLYLCGPLPFMQKIRSEAIAKGGARGGRAPTA